eukprot:SM012773S26271  [mRNA]  locus=s12773:121:366:- [translate_table: standard]
MRLAVSLQRSLAHAVHTRAGRAMAAASGSRRSASFPAASYSHLMLVGTELPSASSTCFAAFCSVALFSAPLSLALDIVYSF